METCSSEQNGIGAMVPEQWCQASEQRWCRSNGARHRSNGATEQWCQASEQRSNGARHRSNGARHRSKMTRTYRSQISYNGPAGQGWSFNHNRRLVVSPDDPSILIEYNGAARGDAYQIVDSNTILSPKTHFNKVVKEKDGSLLIRNAEGTMCKYFPMDSSPNAGKLAAIITRCGNRMTYEYQDGKLVRVLDSLSRPIEFFYNDRNRLAPLISPRN